MALTNIDEAFLRFTRVYNSNVDALRQLRGDLRTAIQGIAQRDSHIASLQAQLTQLAARAPDDSSQVQQLRETITSLETRLAAAEAATSSAIQEADSLRQWRASLTSLLQPLQPPPPSSLP